MVQITIRERSVDLPALDADMDLDRVSALGGRSGLVCGFEFSGARVPTLELEDITLADGKISRILAGQASMTGTRVRSVDFRLRAGLAAVDPGKTRGPGSIPAS